jgi:hypothetical protein
MLQASSHSPTHRGTQGWNRRTCRRRRGFCRLPCALLHGCTQSAYRFSLLPSCLCLMVIIASIVVPCHAFLAHKHSSSHRRCSSLGIHCHLLRTLHVATLRAKVSVVDLKATKKDGLIQPVFSVRGGASSLVSHPGLEPGTSIKRRLPTLLRQTLPAQSRSFAWWEKTGSWGTPPSLPDQRILDTLLRRG